MSRVKYTATSKNNHKEVGISMIDVVFARTTTITMAETKNKARIKASWGLSTKKLAQRPDATKR